MKFDRSRHRTTGLVPFQRFLRDLGASPATGARWRASGWLKVTKIGRRVFVSKDAIRRFEAEAASKGFSHSQP